MEKKLTITSTEDGLQFDVSNLNEMEILGILEIIKDRVLYSRLERVNSVIDRKLKELKTTKQPTNRPTLKTTK